MFSYACAMPTRVARRMTASWAPSGCLAIRYCPTVAEAPYRMNLPRNTLQAGAQAVNARSRVVKQFCFFVCRAAGGQALEDVPQHGIAATRFIHGEIRFKHA